MNIEEILKINKIKITNQRKKVIETILKLDAEATKKNITLNLKESADVSTIYRIIDLFLEKGIIEKHLNFNDDIYYSLKEKHSHYIVCVKCHKKIKIECPTKQIEKQFEKEGYKILDHFVVIDALCNKCQKIK